MTRKQAWEAIRRLTEAGKLFGFRVDNSEIEAGELRTDEFFVLEEHKHGAYFDQEYVMDASVASLYAAFGTTPPKTIRRTPAFVPLADDDSPSFSRYAEQKTLSQLMAEADVSGTQRRRQC